MNDAVRYLGLNSTKHISILPNAGLPQNEGGHAVYNSRPTNSQNTTSTSSQITACVSSADVAERSPNT